MTLKWGCKACKYGLHQGTGRVTAAQVVETRCGVAAGSCSVRPPSPTAPARRHAPRGRSARGGPGHLRHREPQGPRQFGVQVRASDSVCTRWQQLRQQRRHRRRRRQLPMPHRPPTICSVPGPDCVAAHAGWRCLQSRARRSSSSRLAPWAPSYSPSRQGPSLPAFGATVGGCGLTLG